MESARKEKLCPARLSCKGYMYESYKLIREFQEIYAARATRTSTHDSGTLSLTRPALSPLGQPPPSPSTRPGRRACRPCHAVSIPRHRIAQRAHWHCRLAGGVASSEIGNGARGHGEEVAARHGAEALVSCCPPSSHRGQPVRHSVARSISRAPSVRGYSGTLGG